MQTDDLPFVSFKDFFLLIFSKSRLIDYRIMLSEAENVVDYMPYYYYLFALVPLMLAIGTPGAMCSTVITNQYLVYRVHQIDMPQGSYGSKTSTFNLETITPTQINEFFIRKCALFKLNDLIQNKFDVLLNKVLQESLVSGVLIIFSDINNNYTEDEYINLQLIEKQILLNETNLPIYFIKENDEINNLYEEYGQLKENSDPNIYDLVVKNVFFDSHQLVVSSPQTSAINDVTVTSFQVI